MAGALALTCLGKIGGTIFGKIGECFVAPIQRQFTYMCCFNSNFTELETQLKKLETTKEGVQMGVDENIRNVRVVGPTVEGWLTNANEVTTEVEGIIKDKAKVKEGCLNGWCPNLKLRYSLSRKAVKKTTVVVDLWKDGDKYTQPSYNPPASLASLETIPNRDFMGFESRRLNIEEIVKPLANDDTNLIGICGLAGVGKTTMAKLIEKRAKEDRLFAEVAFVTVGQYPDLTHVQNCIAEIFGLSDLKSHVDPTTRASMVRRRLLQDKKKLLILDDIWSEFKLEDYGIPLERSHGTFKILYTSRSRDLWHDVPTKKEIAVKPLLEEEAWQLFKEKAGNLVDHPDLQPLAKKIVNECGCLPLALVIIGGTLSKKSKGHCIKGIWEDMLYKLTCPSSSADRGLSSRLELSYNDVEDEEAKHLFLLCCLHEEDKAISLEDLARFAFGLSLFAEVYEMSRARDRVCALVDDLKSRYLLLDSESIYAKECVKVHDVVRDMGIYIASRDKAALVSHGAVIDWPRKDTYEHYNSISVISDKISELPEGMTCGNLKFLWLECWQLKKLPCNFFERMEKLKVLELKHFYGILTLQPLKNLTMLALENFGGKLDNVGVIGDLLNLEILSFRESSIEELPKEIKELVNLRLLDLSDTSDLERIPPGVLACLVRLEELYVVDSKFKHWEGESQKEGRNANLKEFESLSYLNTLEINIKKHVVVPELPIFGKLKKFKVIQEPVCDYSINFGKRLPYERQLIIRKWNWDTQQVGGIDMLLRSSDCLFLGEGSNDLVQLLLPNGVDSLQQLKHLEIEDCDTRECLANTINPVQRPPNATAVFPILEELRLDGVRNLREICRGPIPAGSLEQLTKINICSCERLGNLCQLPIVGCLTQLRSLNIQDCDKMEEVFIWKEQREDVHVARKGIEFPQLEFLNLLGLPSLVGFCRGIEHIDFPQLKALTLHDLRKVNCLFHNNYYLSSNSEQNDNIVSFPSSLFPEKVSLPNLEVLKVTKLENLESLGHGPLSVGSLFNLRDFSVLDCGKLLCVFPSQLLSSLRNLEELTVERCNLLKVIFEFEGVDSNEPNREVLSPLKVVRLLDLPKLNYISKRDPMGFKYIQTLEIRHCGSLRYVFAPTVTKSIPQLRELKIWRCEMLTRIVEEENGVGESSVDEVKFPQLESLELCELPNLTTFFPNVDTALPESTDRLHNSMQPQSLFNEKVAIPSLKYLKLLGLENVSDLWRSELLSSSFSKLEKLEVINCASLRICFRPSMAGGLMNLNELLIDDCSTLEAVVGKEEEVDGGHGRKIDKTLFPQLGKLKLRSLPNLRRFCHFTYPLELPLLSEMAIVLCPSMDVFSLGQVSMPSLSLSSSWGYGDLINAKQLLQENGDDPMATSMEKLRTLGHVNDKSKSWQVAETQCRLVAMLERIGIPHKVAPLLYTNSGNSIIALGFNGDVRLWKLGSSKHNPSGKATASVVPQQWQPVSGLVMRNDMTGAKLEEAVPCLALSEDNTFVISACGGKISLFDSRGGIVTKPFLLPPSPVTFLAYHPLYHPLTNDIIAIGLEDSTIHIYCLQWGKVKSNILEGHQKRITGLAFSTVLNILVSSGADAQLCIWSIDTWKKLKSVPIQLPAGKAHNGDTRVQFHSNKICLLVAHETQLAIYDPFRDRIRQCVSQDILPAPISFAAYSCDSQLVYTSFCDGNIGVFDADSLTLQCCIATSAYLSPALLSGSQAVYPLVVAAHPQLPNQFAIGLTDGSVIVMELPTITGQDCRTASPSNASNQTPDQKREDVDVDEDLDKDVDEDALITTRTRTATMSTNDGEEDLEKKGEDMDVDEDLDKDVDEDALITTRMRTATTSTHDGEEDLEENGDYRSLPDLKPTVMEEISKSEIWKLTDISKPSQLRSLGLPDILLRKGEDGDVDEDLDKNVDEDALITTRRRTATTSMHDSEEDLEEKGEDVDVDEDLDKDVDEDAMITIRMRTATTSTHDGEEDLEEKGEDVDVDEDLDKDVDEDALITARTRTATTSTHDGEEDLEEEWKKEEEKKEKKGKAPISG